MFPSVLILASVLAATGLVAPVKAEPGQCLTPDQRRTVVASGKVVPLSKAIRAAKARRNEVVNARLCQGSKGLVYLLTVVARDGKVTRTAIDAQTGKPVEGG
ncbi:MAG: hypothetical protein RO009_20045 [Pseudorhodoplanes sp.]|jgi:uncharacterized membrane protein YkoI|nr:hypothetical protein [Pseudorhodoplanes sp.]